MPPTGFTLLSLSNQQRQASIFKAEVSLLTSRSDSWSTRPEGTADRLFKASAQYGSLIFNQQLSILDMNIVRANPTILMNL